MGQLHDALKASGYTGHNLEQFLVRLVFCLFADDTGIFEPRDIFSTLITERTNPDGSDTGQWINNLFEVLNTPREQRQQTLDQDLANFDYVNGQLFEERLPIPAFNKSMRNLLMAACTFNWDAISPAIFGSLFQSVMHPEERRRQGAHYTTEKNILKVIEPLPAAPAFYCLITTEVTAWHATDFTIALVICLALAAYGFIHLSAARTLGRKTTRGVNCLLLTFRSHGRLFKIVYLVP